MRSARRIVRGFLGFITALGVHGACSPALGATVTPASPRVAQPVTFDFQGAEQFGEFDTAPSPFLDRRLEIELVSPTGRLFRVPGYFAGNGLDVASIPPTLTGTGNAWRARFLPDEQGEWSWVASFRSGVDVAIDLDEEAGAAADFDGASGTFTVGPIDPGAPGFFGRGKLLYADGHHLRFTDGSFFIKGGVDSPENWLGYRGFDNTFDGGGRDVPTDDGLHAFPTHAADWEAGDPDWDSPDTPESNDGRAIIGALNYLSSTGVNSIYFLPMNIGGDARDTWPYADPAIDGGGDPTNNNLAFDVTKLAQWEIVFAHAQEKGLLLHFVLNEAETPNKLELDGATLGRERKLFYRELIARFGYLPAIQWNISEEFNLNLDLGIPTVLEFAAYIKAVDPYGTPVTVHNAGSASPGGPLAGIIGEPDIDLTSIQGGGGTTGWGNLTEAWRDATFAAGRPLPIMIDEPGSPTRDFGNDFDAFRKRVIWPVLGSGGGGEWFINDFDQSLEDFRLFDKIWVETGIAVAFFEENTAFWLMDPSDELVTGDTAAETAPLGGTEVLARPGFAYVAYYPDATDTGAIDLTSATGTVTARWFNPREGVFTGAAFQLLGGGVRDVPAAPSPAGEDWVLLAEVDNPSDPPLFTLTVVNGSGDGSFPAGQTVQIAANIPGGSVFDRWVGLDVVAPFSPTTSLTMPAMDATVTATFTDAPPGPSVVGFTLIDPVSDNAVASLVGRPVIFRSELTNPQQLNVRAEVSGSPNSVAFAVDGVAGRSESTPPFALFGDSNGDFNAGNLANGVRLIRATPAGGAPFELAVRVLDAPQDGDVNADGLRDFFDLARYLNDADGGEPDADRDGDNDVDGDDVSDFLAALGAPSP